MDYKLKYSAQIDQAYNAAANYYYQRRRIFEKLYRQNYKIAFETANEVFFTIYRKEFDEFSNKILQLFSSTSNISLNTIKLPELKFKDQVINTGLTVSDFLKNGIPLDKASIQRKLGFTYEKVLDNYFKQNVGPVSFALNDFVNIHTGEILQKGLTFKNTAQIRADFAFSNLNTSNKVSNNMELSTELDLRLQNYINDADMINNIMSESGYLNENHFVGGFSVKNYDNNIAYTHSSPLMEEVNKNIAELGYNVSIEEATDMMLYTLSKHIIAITSPTVIGLYKAHSFEWMHDILKSNRYVFHLREYKGNRGKQRQVQVGNSAIYLMQSSKNMFKYSVWKSKKGKYAVAQVKSTSRFY